MSDDASRWYHTKCGCCAYVDQSVRIVQTRELYGSTYTIGLCRYAPSPYNSGPMVILDLDWCSKGRTPDGFQFPLQADVRRNCPGAANVIGG